MTAGDVPAVVLAAGEGRRLAPLTNTRPKPMVPVANRPILEHVLEALVDAAVDEVVFVVGYQHERIRNHFGDGDDWGVDLSYVEQSPQLGTGHAIEQAEGAVDGPFMVLNGDRIVEPSIIEEVRETLAEHSPVISVTGVQHPSTFGVVTLADGQLDSIEEKPLDPAPTELINAGVYGFDESIFEAIRETEMRDGELAITDTLDRLSEEQPIPAIRYDGRWLDVTHLWDLPVVNAEMLAADDTEPVSIEHAAIGSDVVIADTASIGANTTIVGGTAIDAGARIGPNVVLENTVVLSDATVAAGSVVKNAVIGANVHLGANATIEGGESTVVVEGTAYDGVDFGAAIGDNATTGGGCVFEPGAIVGNDAEVGPGAYLQGSFEPGSTIRRG